MSDTTSQPEPSAQVKVSPLLMECYALGVPVHELERQALGAQHLKERYSSIPRMRRKRRKIPTTGTGSMAAG